MITIYYLVPHGKQIKNTRGHNFFPAIVIVIHKQKILGSSGIRTRDLLHVFAGVEKCSICQLLFPNFPSAVFVALRSMHGVEDQNILSSSPVANKQHFSTRKNLSHLCRRTASSLGLVVSPSPEYRAWSAPLAR